MKLTTKGRYAVRLLMELAMRPGPEPMPLKEAAQRQDISEKYLWQVAAALKKAHLLTATPGPRGGYALARPAERITLLDILSAVETTDALTECLAEPGLCTRSPACAARLVWQDVARKINGITGSITLLDMANQARAGRGSDGYDYAI